MKKATAGKPKRNMGASTKKRKTSRKLPVTPKSRFVSMLRMLWLRSRERAAALKRDESTCQHCKRKAFKVVSHGVTIDQFKVEVHHKHGIDWGGLVELIRERLFQKPEDLVTLCHECHDHEHGKGKQDDENDDDWME